MRRLLVRITGNPPVAVADSYNTQIATPLTVSVPNGVLANDTDIDPNTILSALKESDPQNGALVFNNDGSFTYTPNQGFNGVDTFTYKANDGQLSSNIATVSIYVGIALSPKVTLGITVEFTTTDIGHPGENFDKSPKIYCVVNTGGKQKKAALKKVKMPSGVSAKGIWMKKIALYDKKAVKSAGYPQTINGSFQKQKVRLKVKGKVNGAKVNDLDAIEILIVPPQIISVVQHSGSLEITGKYFGIKPPKLALLPMNGDKSIKIKVDKKSLQVSDDQEQCILKATYKADKVPVGQYYLIFDNKIGIGVNSANMLPVIDIQ